MSQENTIDSKQLDDLLLKYHGALRTLETHLDILIKDFELKYHYMPVEHMKSRIKNIDSAINKLNRRNYKITIENIINHVHDMIGIRIVCSFLNDVEKIVNLIKNSRFITIHEEKDYIHNPKKTGYSSYHLLVNVPVYLEDGMEQIEAEIQIRTMAMDFWASLDHKIQYKFEEKIPNDIMIEMQHCALDINNLDQKMMKLNHSVQCFLEGKEKLDKDENNNCK